MALDAEAYEKNFVQPLRRAAVLPDDLLARYAVDLGMSDADLATRVSEVRQLWNKKSRLSTSIAQIYKLCRIADEQLRNEFGPAMESRPFWEQQHQKQVQSATEGVSRMAAQLQDLYGKIKVVTKGLLDRVAQRSNLSPAQALEAAAQAGIAVVDAMDVPKVPPADKYAELIERMLAGAVPSVPLLVHPEARPFSVAGGRYACANDPTLRLDVAAVEARQRELDHQSRSGLHAEQLSAMRILAEAVRDGVDLNQLAIYHLAHVAKDAMAGGLGPIVAIAELELAGLSGPDAALLAVSVVESSGGASGATEVRRLLAEGRLSEAVTAFGLLPPTDPHRAELQVQIDDHRDRLRSLLAVADAASARGDEVAAAAALREAARISAHDAESKLSTVPVPAPVNLRLGVDNARLRLHWDPAEGHDDDGVTYVVRRAVNRTPVSVTDGTAVGSGEATDVLDASPPLASKLHYAVFAVGARRPASRPASVSCIVTPPVTAVEAKVGESEVTLTWRAHPKTEAVLVRRSDGAGPVQEMRAEINGCRFERLPQGVPQKFEVVATYRSADGSVLQAAPVVRTATPRAVARPLDGVKAERVTLNGQLGVRLTWVPVDKSPVHFVRASAVPSWPIGAIVTSAELSSVGQPVTGRRISGDRHGLEAELPPGVHQLVPVSEGGTGLVIGRAVAIALAAPVRDLTATCFSTYATVSWEWPKEVQQVEATWLTDDGKDRRVLNRAEYVADGGLRVPLREKSGRVEVRSVAAEGQVRALSAPVAACLEPAVRALVSYSLRPLPSLPGLGPKRKVLRFHSTEGCAGVRVRLEAVAGRVMPTEAGRGQVLLDAPVDLDPNGSAEHVVVVPRSLKRPYWLRCFVVAGQTELQHPPPRTLRDY